MQSAHNVCADNKALGLSSLQEAEAVLSIIEQLQLGKTDPPSSVKILNQDIKARINLQRADLPSDVSAEGANDTKKNSAARNPQLSTA